MSEQIKPKVEKYLKLEKEVKDNVKRMKDIKKQVKELKEEIMEYLVENDIQDVNTDLGKVSVQMKKALEPLNKDTIVANLTKELKDQIKAEQIGERILEREQTDKQVLKVKLNKEE